MPFREVRREYIRAYMVEYEPLLIISSLWFLVQYLRFSFPPLFGTIQSQFGVSNTETGLLFTCLMLAYAIMQFPAGIVSDRIGQLRTISLAAFLFSVVGVSILVAFDFVVLFSLAVLMGGTTAAHKTASINLISNIYSEDAGLCLGFLDTVGQFGGVIAPIVAIALLSSVGWRWVFAAAGLVGVGLAITNWVRIDDARHQQSASTTVDRTLKETKTWTYFDILANRRLVVFVIITMTFTFAWNGISAFLPLYLSVEKGIETHISSLLYSGFFVVSVSQLGTGRVSDSSSQLIVGLMTFCSMIVAVLSLMMARGVVAVGVLTLLTGAAFHGFRPVRDSYLMTLIPDSIGGGGLGMIRTCMIVLGALAPGTIGFVADAAGYTAAFNVVLGALLLGASLSAALVVTK